MWHLNQNRFDPAKICYKQYVTKFLFSQDRKILAIRLFLSDWLGYLRSKNRVNNNRRQVEEELLPAENEERSAELKVRKMRGEQVHHKGK